MGRRSLVWLMVLAPWGLGGCGGDETTSDEKKGPGKVIVGADTSMRSCELLVSNTSTATLDAVVFQDSVVGAFKKRGDRTAIAFVAKEDVPIDSGAVVVILDKGGVSGLKLDKVKSRCFDGKGAEMPNALWALQ